MEISSNGYINFLQGTFETTLSSTACKITKHFASKVVKCLAFCWVFQQVILTTYISPIIVLTPFFHSFWTIENMVKTNAEKQKEYREWVKAKQNSDYLKKDRKRKKVNKELLKKSPVQYREYKWKDRERKAAKKAAEQSLNLSTNSTPKKFSKQALGKAKHRASKHLPWSPEKRKQVITHLLQNLSPSSKADEYKKVHLTSTLSNQGRPSVSDTVKDKMVLFLKQPDISYCNPR